MGHGSVESNSKLLIHFFLNNKLHSKDLNAADDCFQNEADGNLYHCWCKVPPVVPAGAVW